MIDTLEGINYHHVKVEVNILKNKRKVINTRSLINCVLKKTRSKDIKWLGRAKSLI